MMEYGKLYDTRSFGDGYDEKIYFAPGDKVKVNKLPNAPVMYVERKKTLTIKSGDPESKVLQGIVCRWFDNNNDLQEGLFSTKDLVKID